jgi:multimeric flavodoxin WrbA
MKILGISTSRRTWGNTDIMVKTALHAAKEAGAETKMLNPASWDLKPCTGCMSCIFKEVDCVIKDRFHEIIEGLRWADAVVLGSPTYILEGNSVLKNIQDRLLGFGHSRELEGKLGLSLAPAGVQGWEGSVLTQLSRLFLFTGMKVVDQFVGHAQGPGEILYDEGAIERAKRGGRALAAGESAYLGDPGICPSCHLDDVMVRPEGKAYCQLCNLTGDWSEVGGEWKFTPDKGPEMARFSRDEIARHNNEKILPSGPRFKKNIKEIMGRVAAFKASIE